MLPPPTQTRPLRCTSMMRAFLVAAAVVAAVTSAVEAAPEDASWLGKRLASSSHQKNSRPKDLYSFGIGELILQTFELGDRLKARFSPRCSINIGHSKYRAICSMDHIITVQVG